MSKIPFRRKVFVHSLYPISGIFTSLGVWQFRRWQEKEELLARIENQKKLGTVLFLDAEKIRNSEVQDKVNYYKVAIQGTFDHSREILIKPRSKVINEPAPTIVDNFNPNNFLRSGNESINYGCFVVTPFCVDGKENENLTILVNRGFIEEDLAEQKDRNAQSLPNGKETIIGIFRKSGDRNSQNVVKEYFGSSQEDQNGNSNFAKLTPKYAHTSFKNHSQLCNYISSKSTNEKEVILPICIDEDDLSPNKKNRVTGTPEGDQTVLQLPNNHLGYLLQWFGLALGVIYVRRSWFGRGTEFYRKTRRS